VYYNIIIVVVSDNGGTWQEGKKLGRRMEWWMKRVKGNKSRSKCK
jgi:hypothetical protein